MDYFKRNPWMLPMIGGLVALISIFTPTSYNYRYGIELYYIWMNQLAIDIVPGFIEPYLLRTNLSLVILSNGLSSIIFVSSLVLLTSTNIHRKNSFEIKKLKWIWLISAILIAVSTLAWIISMEVYYNVYGSSHWTYYRPTFGVIGPFIGSGLILSGLFLSKANRESKELEENPPVSNIKRLPLITAIIGSFITIVAIFSPATTFNLPGNLTYIWMNQMGYRIGGLPFGAQLWRFNLYLVLFTTTLTIIIFTCAIILITTTSIFRKDSGKIPLLRKKWLILAITISVSTIIWIIYMEIVYQIEGYSHWQSYNPQFGVIGPFIGAGFILGAFILTKKL